MFLKSIKLKNFRCFSDHELPFANDDSDSQKQSIRTTTILLGENGAGKSNLLTRPSAATKERQRGPGSGPAN